MSQELGTIINIEINTNGGYWATQPDSLGDIGQSIKISKEGCAEISTSSWENNKIITKTDKKTLTPQQIEQIFSMLTKVYHHGGNQEMIYDIGGWSICITNSDGDTYYQTGNLIGDPPLICQASDLIRQTLEREDLLVFDDYPIYPIKLSFVYMRNTKDQQQIMETITLEAKNDIIKASKSDTKGYQAKLEYQIPDEISNLLRNLWMDEFAEFKDYLEHQVITTNNKEHYQLEISDNRGEVIRFASPYGFDYLPEIWDEVCQSIQYFLQVQDVFFESLSKEFYNKKIRKENQKTFCKVAFFESRKLYSYLADNDTYEIGDRVIVPVGQQECFQIATIRTIDYQHEQNAPYPINKIKKIVKKYQPKRDFAVVCTPEVWLETHKNLYNLELLCEGYAGAWNQEQLLKNYQKDPKHQKPIADTLEKWNNLRLNYAEKIINSSSNDEIVEILNNNHFKLEKMYWVSTKID